MSSASVSKPEELFAPGSVINGTPVKADTGVVPVINPAGLTGLVAGKTYQIVGNVTAETVAVIADATLLIPAGATLTLTGAGITGAGTVIVEAGGSATGMPAISTQKLTGDYSNVSVNPTTADFTVSSTKNLATGRLDVKLYGTVTGEEAFSAGVIAQIWATKGNQRPAGSWSWVSFDDLLPELAANFSIKHISQTLLYYKGNTVLSTEPEEAVADSTDAANIYISADDRVVYKWKKFTTKAEATEWWGLLLWTGASTTTLEVTPASGPDFTVTLDWSGVRIDPPAAK
jgi:hypothetical protein